MKTRSGHNRFNSARKRGYISPVYFNHLNTIAMYNQSRYMAMMSSFAF